MSIDPSKTASDIQASAQPARSPVRNRSRAASPAPFRVSHLGSAQPQESLQRQAELFYLQKQIQSQTPMVLVLEDGEVIEGCIEWYDRNALKVRGRTKTLVYKSAIKYMYKVGDAGR
jgi:sRNA-binding regulator protein Hfq